MRLYVQIAGECITVACRHEDTVADVGKEAVRKLKKLIKECQGDEYVVAEYRKTLGGSLLDPDDFVRDLLKDGEFVLAVLQHEVVNGYAHPIVSQPQLSKVVHSPEDDLFHYYKDPAQFVPPTEVLVLDGESLTTEDMVLCGRGRYKIALAKEAENKIRQARSLLDDIVNQNKVVYGITTGFGNFANICIPPEKIVQLQVNLIRSHCCGVGPPMPPSRVRMLLALRINVLAKGYSGISLEVVHQMVEAFNTFCMPWVPEKGSVGCSGDLAPLAHLALGLMGEGRMWSPETGWDEASKVLAAHNLRPIQLAAKEGLALINGTQMVTALGAEAVERADAIARQADIVAALTLDVLKGTTRAFAADVHRVRPHRGQNQVAKVLRSLLHSPKNPSQIAESHRFCTKVQDAYTLRCVPQVHGVTHDTIAFVRQVITTELNSATDNPLVFGDKGEIISGGNFHGEYPAKVLDYLAIGIHEIAQISERRLERLINKDLSGLPAFLASEPGLNSGFMMVQVTAASLVSENKVLTHPSSVDSIPTSGGQEDHVSMGGFAARKVLRVIEHVEQVLAMELLAACQGLDFLRPLTTTKPLQDVYKLVRSVVPTLDRDRYMAADIEAVTKLLQNEQVWSTVKPFLDSVSLEMDDDDHLDRPQFSPTTSSLDKEHEAKKRKIFHHMYHPHRRSSLATCADHA